MTCFSLTIFGHFCLTRIFSKNLAVKHNYIWAPNTMLSFRKNLCSILRKHMDRRKGSRTLVYRTLPAKAGGPKTAIFDILINVTLKVNMTNRQMTPIFRIYSLSSIRWSIYFLQLHGIPFLHYDLVCKINTHLHAKDYTFKAVNIDILFL